MIAIADVSFYVEKGDIIDIEAKKEGILLLSKQSNTNVTRRAI